MTIVLRMTPAKKKEKTLYSKINEGKITLMQSLLHPVILECVRDKKKKKEMDRKEKKKR